MAIFSQRRAVLLRVLAVSVLVACVLVQRPAAAQFESEPDYVKAIVEHPQVVRFYRFAELAHTTGQVPSKAGQPISFQPGPPQRLELVPGQRATRRAVHLDDSWLETAPAAGLSAGFTVELRMRRRGPGKQLGNGRSNGMLVAQGSGYWDGWRLWTAYPDRALRFEIGRARPSSAFGVTCRDLPPDGVWHHLAACWDGKQMRLYVNGLLVTVADYDGPYVAAAGPLKLGYANHGVGSLSMEVEELAIYRGALTPAEILAHACLRPDVARRVVEPLMAATAAVARGEAAAAQRAFLQLAELPDAGPAVQSVARLAAARAAREQGHARQAVQMCVELSDNPAAPEHLRATALRYCLPQSRDELVNVPSAAIFTRLLEMPDLQPRERLLCQLGLAERLLQENQPLEAQRQLERARSSGEVNDRERVEIELQMAHCLYCAESYADARQAYQKLSANPSHPAELRALAALAYAHCYECERRYADAATAFDHIAGESAIPEHLRWEARQRAGEMRRLAKGLPARDSAAGRTQLPPRPVAGRRFYVAANGDDTNPGTESRPLASLEGARDAVRRCKAQSGLPDGGVEVLIGAGVYPQLATLQLTEQDSGTADAPIVYRAAGNGSPRVAGGVELSDFQPVTDQQVLARFDPAVRHAVVCLDLHKLGIDNLGSLGQRGFGKSGYPTHPWPDLYVDGRAMQLARWPNDGWLEIDEVLRGKIGTDQSRQPGVFTFPAERSGGWQRPFDIRVFGAWGHLWEGTSLRVAALDDQRRQVTTEQPAVYGFEPGVLSTSSTCWRSWTSRGNGTWTVRPAWFTCCHRTPIPRSRPSSRCFRSR